jgi:hypothetical protein
MGINILESSYSNHKNAYDKARKSDSCRAKQDEDGVR